MLCFDYVPIMHLTANMILLRNMVLILYWSPHSIKINMHIRLGTQWFECTRSWFCSPLHFIIISIFSQFANYSPGSDCLRSCFLFSVHRWSRLCVSGLETWMLLLFSGFSGDLDICLKRVGCYSVCSGWAAWERESETRREGNILPILSLSFPLLFLLFFLWECPLEVLNHTSFFHRPTTAVLYCLRIHRHVHLAFACSELSNNTSLDNK